MRNLELAWNSIIRVRDFSEKVRVYNFRISSLVPISRFLCPPPTTEDRILFRSSLLPPLYWSLKVLLFFQLFSVAPGTPFDDRPIFWLFCIGFLILFMIYVYSWPDRLFLEFFLMGLSHNLNIIFLVLFLLFINGILDELCMPWITTISLVCYWCCYGISSPHHRRKESVFSEVTQKMIWSNDGWVNFDRRVLHFISTFIYFWLFQHFFSFIVVIIVVLECCRQIHIPWNIANCWFNTWS